MAVESILRFAQQTPSLTVLASQIAAAGVNRLAKILETSPNRIHPFQVLNIRFLITGMGSLLYLRLTEPPGGLWGPRKAIGLLAIRAVGGIFGAMGFYFSIMSLSLTEATALNFMAPLGAIVAAKYMYQVSLKGLDYITATICLVSVIAVLQPRVASSDDGGGTRETTSTEFNGVWGIISGLLGVLGGTISLVAMRYIGQGAHPLVGVNWFSWLMVIVTTVSLLIMPDITWPSSYLVWLGLVIIGVLGLFMECLLAIGLSSDTSATATVMIYSQIVWALLFDWILDRQQLTTSKMLGSLGVIASLSVASGAWKSVFLSSHEDEYATESPLVERSTSTGRAEMS